MKSNHRINLSVKKSFLMTLLIVSLSLVSTTGVLAHGGKHHHARTQSRSAACTPCYDTCTYRNNQKTTRKASQRAYRKSCQGRQDSCAQNNCWKYYRNCRH